MSAVVVPGQEPRTVPEPRTKNQELCLVHYCIYILRISFSSSSVSIDQ